jgi:S-adenosylmethionine/arginine decarboxylase-like enzyme
LNNEKFKNKKTHLFGDAICRNCYDNLCELEKISKENKIKKIINKTIRTST